MPCDMHVRYFSAPAQNIDIKLSDHVKYDKKIQQTKNSVYSEFVYRFVWFCFYFTLKQACAKSSKRL